MRTGARMRSVLAVAAVAGAVGGCAWGPSPEFRGDQPLAYPEPDAVDAVLFLVGDAGAATFESSPLTTRLRDDVEYWSGRIGRDSAVTVAFLGDNVYPVGIRDRDHPEFPTDSARLWSQIRILDGPEARRTGAQGLFLAGNHDWGNTTGELGIARLRNQEALLDSARADGIGVRMIPAPGQAGPYPVDLRNNARLLALDTHWYLQSPTSRERRSFFAALDSALADAEDRHVILAAHHPYQSTGPHGLLTPGDQGFGIMYLLQRSGTLVQDLNSPIYSGFLERMRASFRRAERRPLLFAGGHDHSLQVLDPETPDGPHTVVVSGAGSKLTPVADSETLRYAASRPGYMALVFRRNEAVDLYVTAAASEELSCAEEEDVPACVADRAAAMELVYFERLAPEAALGG